GTQKHALRNLLSHGNLSQVCKQNNPDDRRSMLPLSIWVIVVICFLPQAFAQAPVPKSSAGRQTFETICASCHGLNGKGGERGPDIATRPDIVRLSDAELQKILHNGKPQAGMPAFSGLGEAKLKDVLDYLRTLQGKRSTPVVTANIGNGKE